jgi:hypothetical protein
MLSFPVYRERHPRSAISHPRLTSFPFCFSQPSNLQTFQRANDRSSNTLEIFPSHTFPLLTTAHPVSPLAATLMELPASAANKGLTEILTPLDATLTKNRGVGPSLTFQRSNVQQSVSILFTSLLVLCALCPKSVSQLYCIQSVPHSFSKKGVYGGTNIKFLKSYLKSVLADLKGVGLLLPLFIPQRTTVNCGLSTLSAATGAIMRRKRRTNYL